MRLSSHSQLAPSELRSSRGVGTEVVELGVQESVRPWGRRQEQPVRVKGSRY